MMRDARLPTEAPHPRSRRLDMLSPQQVVRLMHADDARPVAAVGRQLPAIARAIRLISDRLARGGRLIFIGAGTSGRLGILEAAECPPTFHTPARLVQGIIAGGPAAVFRAREGAEDRRRGGRRDLRHVRRGDVVVGITASGVTPYVDAALRAAARRGAATILIACVRQTPIRAAVRILLPVGPELLTGSTRLKAGTATKLALNMLTLGVMVRLGKTYGHLMVDVRPTSRKLRARAVRIVAQLTGRPAPAAARTLRAARGRVKTAVLMLRNGLTARQAEARLSRMRGSLRRALAHGTTAT